MKKFFYTLLCITLFSTGLTLASCGDEEKDEPDVPTSQQLESEHGLTNDTYLIYDIDLAKDSSSIYVYNAVFYIGETASPAMNVRVDAPVTVDKTGKVFTFAGTDITPYLMRGNTPVPMPSMPVTNLLSVVNTAEKTYSISFDCHGGHYDKTGKLK